MRLAVIPARGGSKRILNKNIRYFCGKPIIAYSIEKARQSGLFDDVVVSTDSTIIAEIALRCGAGVPFMRPKDLATDKIHPFSAVSHAIRFFEEKGITLESICCIYATAPLMRVGDLIKGHEALTENKFDFVMAVTTYDFPVYRSLRLCDDVIVPEFRDTINERSQDLPELVRDCGQFYWGSSEAFHQNDTVFRHPHIRAAGVSVPKKYVQDIDTEEDWEEAEIRYRILNNV